MRSEAKSTSPQVVLHSVSGRPGTALARWLGRASAPFGDLSPLVGPFSHPVFRLSGPEATIGEAIAGLPEGSARPEAAAVRLRRAGVRLAYGAPDPLPDAESYLRLCHARGASSVEVVRADPSLVTEMQLGAFFHAYWRQRVVRRAGLLLGRGLVTRLAGPLLGLASDVAFWLGVGSVATEHEWERFTRSSYVVFYYHRIGERAKPGEERLDVAPSQFARHLGVLRLLRFRSLTPEQLLAFHSDPATTLPPRSYVIGADDGFRDAVEAFRRQGTIRPHVFVNTDWVGKTAWWGYEEPLASWDELSALEAAGGVIGSHCRGHPRLPELDDHALRDELGGSLQDIRERLPNVVPILAYPHGRHDERVRSAAAAAGYRAAFTTEPGRNGAGTDPYCLRRLGLKDWDGYTAVAWKALTGELLPWAWERARRRISTRERGPAAREA